MNKSKATRRINGKKTTEYRTWIDMRSRCNNPNQHKYKRYGGRGIKCLFATFEEFYAEVGDKPSPKHSIDRIDNNGHYEKGNVRWADSNIQMNNMNSNHLITHNGITQSIRKWERQLGCSRDLIWQRIVRLNWSIEKALKIMFFLFFFLPINASAKFELMEERRDDDIVELYSGYQYAPTAMQLGLHTYLFWCGLDNGDNIFTSSSIDGKKWTNPQIFIPPSRTIDSYDGLHLCDPSIVYDKKTNNFFMYTSGHPILRKDGGLLSETTYVTYQRSQDGIVWQKLGMLFAPVNYHENLAPHQKYGTGQMSVLYLDGWFYGVRTDTTVFWRSVILAMRSRSPHFSNPEFLTKRGWRKNWDGYYLFEAASVDIATLGSRIIMAVNGIAGQTNIKVFDKNFRRKQRDIIIPNINWTEGAGIEKNIFGAIPKLSRRKYKLTLFYSSGSGQPQDWVMKRTEVIFKVK